MRSFRKTACGLPICAVVGWLSCANLSHADDTALVMYPMDSPVFAANDIAQSLRRNPDWQVFARFFPPDDRSDAAQGFTNAGMQILEALKSLGVYEAQVDGASFTSPAAPVSAKPRIEIGYRSRPDSCSGSAYSFLASKTPLTNPSTKLNSTVLNIQLDHSQLTEQSGAEIEHFVSARQQSCLILLMPTTIAATDIDYRAPAATKQKLKDGADIFAAIAQRVGRNLPDESHFTWLNIKSERADQPQLVAVAP